MATGIIFQEVQVADLVEEVVVSADLAAGVLAAEVPEEAGNQCQIITTTIRTGLEHI